MQLNHVLNHITMMVVSDHIINAGVDCLMYIAQLFTGITMNGNVPDSCLYSTTIPILKGRHDDVSDRTSEARTHSEFDIR